MTQAVIYKVNEGQTTPDEPHAGWYWANLSTDAIEIHGSFGTKEEAYWAMKSWDEQKKA